VNENNALLTMRIIVVSLALGILVFGGVVVAMGGREEAEIGWLTIAGMVFAVAGVVAGFVATRAVVGSCCRAIAADGGRVGDRSRGPSSDSDDADSRLLASFQTVTVLRCAFLEGPAFVCLVAYMREGSPLSLGIAFLMVIGILSHFPRAESLRAWLESRRREIRDLGGIRS